MIDFDPCGTIIGWSRVNYRARCRFYGDDDRVTYIVFYRAPEGAARCTFPTPFHPDRNRRTDRALYAGECGELDSPRWQWLPPDYTLGWMRGDAPDGTAEQFAGGAVVPAGLLPDGTLPWALLPPCAHPPGIGRAVFSTDGWSVARIALGCSTTGGPLVAQVALSGQTWAFGSDQSAGGISLDGSSAADVFSVEGGLALGGASLDLDGPAIALGGSSEEPVGLFALFNGSGGALAGGQVVGVSISGDAVLGQAASPGSVPAVGLVFSGGSPGATVTIKTSDLITLSDWTSAVGTVTLTPGTLYYLSDTPGQLSTSPPTATDSLQQPIGTALSTTTLSLGILPPATTVRQSEGGTGSNLSLTGPGLVVQTSAGAPLGVIPFLGVDKGGTASNLTGYGPGAVVQGSLGGALSTVPQLPPAAGGTGADLSLSGPGLVVQTTAGAALSVITSLDLARGGTGADLSLTGPGLLYQQAVGTVVQLTMPGTDHLFLTTLGGNFAWADATELLYSPTNPSDWSGTPAARVGSALDRLAALGKALNGGTGP